MIYHLLPEVETFGERAGGAISRWVANVVRSGDERVICSAADGSWRIDPQRVIADRWLRWYGGLLRRREFRISPAKRVLMLGTILKRITRRLSANDVLYIHNRPEYVLALPRAKKRQFKVVLHMHNDHLKDLSVKQAHGLDANLMVYNSSFLADQGRCVVSESASAVLFNGADEKCFYPSQTTGTRQDANILFVGRLVPEKGVRVLVDAAKCLSEQGVDVKVRIVGTVNFGENRSSSYMEECRRCAPANVEFVAYKSGDQLAEEFRKADIFCSPSCWDEPFGMVNVEAMASGLAVVTTRGGGVPEVFAEGGAIMVAKNSVPELAEALKSLVLDAEKRLRLAEDGLANFRRRFRWSEIRAKYDDLMLGLNNTTSRGEQGMVPATMLKAEPSARAGF